MIFLLNIYIYCTNYIKTSSNVMSTISRYDHKAGMWWKIIAKQTRFIFSCDPTRMCTPLLLLPSSNSFSMLKTHDHSHVLEKHAK